jgi:putative solute:sodium symporter small subunit
VTEKNQKYWNENIKILSILLSLWFFVSFICGILLVDFLDEFRIGGFKLGFWMAQQGAIYVFVLLIFVYIKRMDALDHKFHVSESEIAERIASTANPATSTKTPTPTIPSSKAQSD